jgi:hypothetical protein
VLPAVRGALSKRRQYRGLPDVEPGPEVDAKIRAMIELADWEIEEARVNFRWGREELATVKRAVAILGVPYQMYIKQVVFRQAVADIRDARRVRIGRARRLAREPHKR